MESTNGTTGSWARPEDETAAGLLAHPDPPGDIDYEEDETDPPDPPPPSPDYPGGGDGESLPAPAGRSTTAENGC